MPDENRTWPQLLGDWAGSNQALGIAAGLGGLVGGGGGLYMASREKGRPGETPMERKQRLLLNAGVGAGLGATAAGGGIYGAGLLTNNNQDLTGPGTRRLADFMHWISGTNSGDSMTLPLGVEGAAVGAGAGAGIGQYFKRRALAKVRPAQKIVDELLQKVHNPAAYVPNMKPGTLPSQAKINAYLQGLQPSLNAGQAELARLSAAVPSRWRAFKGGAGLGAGAGVLASFIPGIMDHLADSWSGPGESTPPTQR